MDFQKQVIEQSFEKPVVVDFWAPWCGPCRVLGPTIEQLAAEQADRWTLVKVNTEEAYELAERYQIQSIPNVKMFYEGDVVAEFMGALPRTAIEQWLEEHLPDDRKKNLQLLLGKLDGAIDEAVLEELEEFAAANPDLKEAAIEAARRLVWTKPGKALELVAGIHMGDKFFDAAEDLRELGRLLAFNGNGNPAAEALEKARTAFQTKDLEAGLQELIRATMIDKNFQDDLPRKASIAMFRTLGTEHPLTKKYRRQFDMALY